MTDNHQVVQVPVGYHIKSFHILIEADTCVITMLPDSREIDFTLSPVVELAQDVTHIVFIHPGDIGRIKR